MTAAIAPSHDPRHVIELEGDAVEPGAANGRGEDAKEEKREYETKDKEPLV
jgi:hypothetical protein